MKRISFFLTLVFAAALSSLYVASAQDPDQPAPPAEAAPADEAPAGEAPAAPADEAPAPAAPSDEAPADEAPAPPSDEPPMDEPPMDGPSGEEPPPVGTDPLAEPAPAEPAPAKPAPAAQPAPAAKSASLSSLKVSEGEAQLERRAEGAAEPLRARLASGQAAGLTTLDTALFGSEAGGVALFGGCEVTLSEHTTFKVISVGAEVSVVEILGIELELTRGTILEAAFGSLQLSVSQGNTTARNVSGVPQVIQFNFNGARVTVTVPAGSGGTQPAIQVSSTGQITVSGAALTVTTQPLDASGNPSGPPTTSTVAAGSSIDGSTASTGDAGGTFAEALAEASESATSDTSTTDSPPPGTTPGTSPNTADGSDPDDAQNLSGTNITTASLGINNR